jgi:homocysteine S-methyltransferase
MIIKDYIKEQVLLMDGAMGTYFAELTEGHYTLSEPANISKPGLIMDIHKAYIGAGAKLIRTNTFAANPYTLYRSFDEVKKIIIAGIDIANEAVKGTDCYVAYSIGPIGEPYDIEDYEIESTYRKLIDIGLLKNVKIILLETFSRIDQVNQLVEYIHEHGPNIQIMTNFTVNQHGYTKVGVNKEKIIQQTRQQDLVTTYGFNCGIGASHLLSLIKTLDFDPSKMVAVPNAGYPDQQLERMVYQSNADYFADTMIKICEEGVRIVGGCCGTTPEHIRKIRERLNTFDFSEVKSISRMKRKSLPLTPLHNSFREKLENNQFVVAVELDPPFKMDMSLIISSAHLLKEVGVDIITFADSPLGRTRADALLVAAKIKQLTGMEVLPHVCLRDKNLIALRGGLVGAHLSDIRNILIVTGDPIPSDDRDEVKSVFNMNAISFMQYVTEINSELDLDTFYIGGALNPYTQNMDVTLERVLKKKEAGASYLLTQPVYNDAGIEAVRIVREKTGMKILGGIMPLVSLRNARFLHYEFPGILIPDDVMAKFSETMTKDEAEKVGVELAVALATKMKPHVDGLYFMTPFNRATMIEKIIKKLDVL